MKYEKPTITDFGSIAGHTFDTPGVGDKSPTPLELDPMYGEFSGPGPLVS
jgi:hypothetical protein